MFMADNENPATAASKIGETMANQLANAASMYGGAFAGSFKAMQDYQAKLLHFVQENMEANVQLTQKILQPRSPTEFMEFLTTHLRERATAIADQTKELAALGQDAAKKAADSFTHPTKS
jgi:hypothetical protein